MLILRPSRSFHQNAREEPKRKILERLILTGHVETICPDHQHMTGKCCSESEMLIIRGRISAESTHQTSEYFFRNFMKSAIIHNASQERITEIRAHLAVAIDLQYDRAEEAEIMYRACLERFKALGVKSDCACITLTNLVQNLLKRNLFDEAYILCNHQYSWLRHE